MASRDIGTDKKSGRDTDSGDMCREIGTSGNLGYGFSEVFVESFACSDVSDASRCSGLTKTAHTESLRLRLAEPEYLFVFRDKETDEENKLKLKVIMVSWDLSDRYVATAVNDFTIRIWNSDTGNITISLWWRAFPSFQEWP